VGRKNIGFGTQRLSHERKKPANGGLLSDMVEEISGDQTGWLATQCRWSPALLGFPANREFYREFCKIVASRAPETLNSGVVAGLPMQIPYAMEQGIISAEQGILAQEQGISTAKLEINAG
jgi:hypothetical protein